MPSRKELYKKKRESIKNAIKIEKSADLDEDLKIIQKGLKSIDDDFFYEKEIDLVGTKRNKNFVEDKDSIIIPSIESEFLNAKEVDITRRIEYSNDIKEILDEITAKTNNIENNIEANIADIYAKNANYNKILKEKGTKEEINLAKSELEKSRTHLIDQTNAFKNEINDIEKSKDIEEKIKSVSNLNSMNKIRNKSLIIASLCALLTFIIIMVGGVFF